MSYSIEDATDREAMTELHDALELVNLKMATLRTRGFTVELLDERKDASGKVERVSLSRGGFSDNKLEGKLVARVTKSYDLPYGR